MDLRLASITVLVWGFAFLNGANDSGTMAASVISSRCLSTRKALIIAAAASFMGALLLGSAVAKTMGAGVIRLEAIPDSGRAVSACAAAVASAILWCLMGWRLGLPSSYTHALLGGWLGGFVGLAGFSAVDWRSAGMVLAAVLAAPPLGLAAAWACFRAMCWMGSELSLQVLPILRSGESVAFATLSLAHGANAAQNSMAVLVLGGLLLGRGAVPSHFAIPLWVRASCSAAFSLGVLIGFTRTLKTVGFKIFRVGTIHSLCALGVSGALLLACTLLGLPLSPGQINSSAIMGAGAGQNARAVRWGVAVDLLANWVLTFPGAALLSYLLVKC